MASITNLAPSPGAGAKSPLWSGTPNPLTSRYYEMAFDSSYPDNGESIADIFEEFQELLELKPEQKGSYLFDIDYTNQKIIVYDKIAGSSEVQTLTLVDGPTGGTFTVTWNGQTTSALAYNVSAANATTAMDNLSNLAVGDCIVTRGGSGTQASPYVYTFTFGGEFACENVPAITASGASLTGGSIAVGTTTTGTGVKERQTLTLTAGAPSANEVQTITLTAGLATETFKLTHNAVESSAAVTIPTGGYAFVTAAQIKTCLLTIPAWSALTADITVAEGPGATYTVTFSGTLAATNISAISITSKTGAADGSVAETTAGVIISTAKLTFNAHESSAISFGTGGYTTVTTAQIVTALSSISDFSGLTITASDDTNALYDILVGGSTGGPFTLDFSKTLTGNIGAISVTSKTGTADGSVAETTQGVAGVSEVQTVTLTDGPTGGTFTITFGGQTTSALAYNASSATATTALEALSNVRVGEAAIVRTGSGTQASPYIYTITWRADSGDTAEVTSSGAALTGTTATVATTTQGSEITDASSLSSLSVRMEATGYAR